jgi:hypothetical protein
MLCTAIAATGASGSAIQRPDSIIENRRREARPDDGILANAGFLGVEKEGLTATQR